MYYLRPMDWTFAIETNRAHLVRIVAGLFAVLGVAAGGVMERVPRAVRRAVLSVLRPAESAVRRLIVLAARDLADAPPLPLRAFPAGRVISGARSDAVRFQLFDLRKRFDFNRPKRFKAGEGPRITFFVDDPRAPPFRGPLLKTIDLNPAREPRETFPARPLLRRLQAVQAALGDLAGEARRLKRWLARRARMKVAKFRDPLRPGPAPGSRKTRRHEAQEILENCRWLCLQAARADTS